MKDRASQYLRDVAECLETGSDLHPVRWLTEMAFDVDLHGAKIVVIDSNRQGGFGPGFDFFQLNPPKKVGVLRLEEYPDVASAVKIVHDLAKLVAVLS